MAAAAATRGRSKHVRDRYSSVGYRMESFDTLHHQNIQLSIYVSKYRNFPCIVSNALCFPSPGIPVFFYAHTGKQNTYIDYIEFVST